MQSRACAIPTTPLGTSLMIIWAALCLAWGIRASAAGTRSESSMLARQHATPSAYTLTVHDVGEYANFPWVEPGTPVEPGSRADRVRDLTFGVSSVNLSDATTEGDLQHWADIARWGRQQGKKFLPRVHFWDGVDRYDGPMRDIEVYWDRLDKFLGAVDLRDLVGIVLAEENVHYAGRPQVLTELYRRVKAKYDVDVWQWYSPLEAVPGSGGWIPADGWVIDPYMVRKAYFRQYLRKYVIAGKPVVVMPWATVFSPPDGKQGDHDYFRLARGQLEVALEFGLPVAFFWCRGDNTYFGGDRSASDTLMDRTNQRVWAYIERVRALPADFTGFASADIAYVGPVALEPDEAGIMKYLDDFSSSKCVDDASMTGFRDLVLDGASLRSRGFNGRPTRATLTYRFACANPAQAPEVSLVARVDAALDGRVEVGLSPDGRDWSCSAQVTQHGEHRLTVTSEGLAAFASLDRFWVRIVLEGAPGSLSSPPMAIEELRVTSRRGRK